MNRNYHIWKDSDLLPWLEKNVHEVLDRIDKKDPIVEEYETKRLTRYHGPLPINISRHILLSDIKGVSPMTDVSKSSLCNISYSALVRQCCTLFSPFLSFHFDVKPIIAFGIVLKQFTQLIIWYVIRGCFQNSFIE